MRTESQDKAVLNNYGDMVVTASAGSGKTKVMIERFIRLVLEHKTEVDRVLAVTFTRLAAAEMRERLAKAIRAEITKGKDIKYLKEQFARLTNANICTIDSFCNTIVKRYFYLADVDPAFTVCDEDRAADLKERAIKNLFAEKYENADEDFLFLVRVFMAKRKDAELKKLVLKIAGFSDTEKDEEEFFTRSLDLYSEQSLRSAENEIVALYVGSIKDLYGDFETAAASYKRSGSEKYLKIIEEVEFLLGCFLKTPSEETLKRCFSVSKKPPKTKGDTDADNEFSSYYSDFFKKRLDKEGELFGKLFPDIRETRLEKTLKTRGVLGKLFALVREFKEFYSKEKLDRGVLDYADVERYAYKILQIEEARTEIKDSFDYIFIDEFQDVNVLQDAIFSLISNGNTFIVGDVKQSIYGFRGSDPDIIVRRAEREDVETVDLAENFRSASAVIKTVNGIFSRLLDERSGFDYKKKPMIYGGLYGDESGVAQIQCVLKDKKGKIEKPAVYSIIGDLKNKREKLSCGRHALVRKLIEENVGTSFRDRDGSARTLTFGDVLVVSRTNRYEDVIAELTRSGIPVVSETDFAVTDYYEINLAVDILTTLFTSASDDAALVSALKSGVGKITDGELMKISDEYFKEDFHIAAKKYAEEKSDDLSSKLRELYEYLSRLSLLSLVESCRKILARVIEEKRLYADISSMPCGRARVQRLERFVASLGSGDDEISLSEFFQKKDIILKKKIPSVVSGGDSVRVMTAHKSKGLEAPMVIVIGVEQDMHRVNQRQIVVCDRNYGIGLDYYDPDKKTKEPSFLKAFILEKVREKTVLEEKRLLYVALTRAEVKLFVVTDTEPKERPVQRPATILDFFTVGDMDYVLRDREDVVSPTFISARKPIYPKYSKEYARAIRCAVEYEYPYKDDLTLSLKRSVTEVNHALKDPLPPVEDEERYVEPVIRTAGDIESGVLYHKFLEHCSFDVAAIDKDIETLVSIGEIDIAAAKTLDREKLKRILSLDIFSKIQGADVYRERAFTAFVPPELVGERGGESVLLQGIVDMFALSDGGAVIVDYKYSGKSDEELISAYKKQLSLYAYAIEKSLGVKVKGAYLINLLSETEIKVEV